MEVYVGFFEYIDYYIGWFVDVFDDFGVFEDMFVYYIFGDNGVSVEGGINGSFNEIFFFNGVVVFEMFEFMVVRIDDFGMLKVYNYFVVGWVYVMDMLY